MERIPQGDAASPSNGNVPSHTAPAKQRAREHMEVCEKRDTPTVLIVMGVSGCGKSTVASLLSKHLHCPFYEGDVFHPQGNIEKMRVGIPLTDEDRMPWLAFLAAIVLEHCSSGQPAVMSCSALKAAYREQLRGSQPLVVAGGCLSSAGKDATRGGDSDSSSIGSNGSSGSNGSNGSCRKQAGDVQPCMATVDQHVAPVCGAAAAPHAAGEGAMACCSGLGQGGKDATLPMTTGVGFVLLEPSREQLQRWVEERAAAGGHFMSPSLLDSQLATLQYSPGELYMHFSGDPFPPPHEVANSILQQLADSSHSCRWAGA